MPKTPNIRSTLVILCGGKSSRMGSPKGLLPFQGRLWLEEQLGRFQTAGGQKAVCVFGHGFERYVARISWIKGVGVFQYQDLTIEIVHNDKPDRGMFSSIQTALRATKGSVFLTPVDNPIPVNFPYSEVEKLLLTPEVDAVKVRGRDSVVHPVGLSLRFCRSIFELDCNHRLDYVLNQAHVCFVERSDLEALNLNTPEEWKKFSKTELCVLR